MPRTLEADQHLPTTTVGHQVEQLRVVCDRDVGLGEPRDAERPHRLEEGLRPFSVDESVVVGEFEEDVLFDLERGPDFLDDEVDRFLLVAAGDAQAGGAELAVVRATARGLHGDPVVGPVAQQIEEGLLREDGKILYIVDDGIPVMLIEESIEL